MTTNSKMAMLAVLCSALLLATCGDTDSAESESTLEAESSFSSIQKEAEQGKADQDSVLTTQVPDDGSGAREADQDSVLTTELPAGPPEAVEKAKAWGVLQPLINGSWKSVSLSENAALIQQLLGSVSEEHHEPVRKITRFRKLALPFYNGVDLYEGETTLKWGTPGIVTFVHGRGEYTLITGESKQIYSLNTRFGLELRTAEQADAYLRFFTAALAGDLGTFQIIENEEDVRWKTPPKAEDRVHLESLVSPLEVRRSENGWAATGVVNYGSTIFSSNFEITDAGVVSMPGEKGISNELPIGHSVFAGPVRLDPDARDVVSGYWKRVYQWAMDFLDNKINEQNDRLEEIGNELEEIDKRIEELDKQRKELELKEKQREEIIKQIKELELREKELKEKKLLAQYTQPAFVQHLINDQHERVQIQGVKGLFYGYGAYMRGIARCPSLLKMTPASLWKLHMQSMENYFILMFKQRLELDKATDLEQYMKSAMEFLVPAMVEGAASGRNDADVLIDEKGCKAPEVVRFVAAAEKLAEVLVRVHLRRDPIDAIKPYERPASIKELPEDVQRLYDEYYLCRVRTRSFYMISGGITDPCDEAWFQFRVAEARATGQPIPVRDSITLWKTSQGPVGKYEERTNGIHIVFDTAPEDFSPEFPDSLLAKRGEIGGSIYFTLNLNKGHINKLTKATLTTIRYSVYGRGRYHFQGRERERVIEDFNELFHLGHDQSVLECEYYMNDRLSNVVFYWFKSRPALADPERLKSRILNHPLLLIMDEREDCPCTLTDEVIERKRVLLAK